MGNHIPDILILEVARIDAEMFPEMNTKAHRIDEGAGADHLGFARGSLRRFACDVGQRIGLLSQSASASNERLRPATVDEQGILCSTAWRCVEVTAGWLSGMPPMIDCIACRGRGTCRMLGEVLAVARIQNRAR